MFNTKNYTKDSEAYNQAQLKDYLEDLFGYKEEIKYNKVNIIIPGFLELVNNSKGEAYNYSSIIEMFEIVSEEFEYGLVAKGEMKSLNFYIIENKVDIDSLKLEMESKEIFEYYEKFIEKDQKFFVMSISF